MAGDYDVPFTPSALNRVLRWQTVVVFQVAAGLFPPLLAWLTTYAQAVYASELGVGTFQQGVCSAFVGGAAAYAQLVYSHYSDKARNSALGRRQSTLLPALLFTGVCLWLLYCPHLGARIMPPYAWFFLLTVGLQVAGTSLNAVVLGWSVELTQSHKQRAKLYMTGQVLGAVGSVTGILLTTLVLPHGFPFGSLASIIIPCYLVACIAMVAFVPSNNSNDEEEQLRESRARRIPLLPSIYSALSNRAFLPVLLVNILLLPYCHFPHVMTQYFVLGIGGEMTVDRAYDCVRLMVIMSALSCCLAAGVSPVCIQAMGAKGTLLLGLVLSAVGSLVVYASMFLHVGLAATAFGIVTGITAGISVPAYRVMFAAAIDYDKLRCGESRAATYASLNALPALLTRGVLTAVALGILESAGFDDSQVPSMVNLAARGGAAGVVWVQPKAVVQWVRVGTTLVPGLCMGIAAVLVHRMWRLTEERHLEVLEQLRLREGGFVVDVCDPLAEQGDGGDEGAKDNAAEDDEAQTINDTALLRASPAAAGAMDPRFPVELAPGVERDAYWFYGHFSDKEAAALASGRPFSVAAVRRRHLVYMVPLAAVLAMMLWGVVASVRSGSTRISQAVLGLFMLFSVLPTCEFLRLLAMCRLMKMARSEVHAHADMYVRVKRIEREKSSPRGFFAVSRRFGVQVFATRGSVYASTGSIA